MGRGAAHQDGVLNLDALYLCAATGGVLGQQPTRPALGILDSHTRRGLGRLVGSVQFKPGAKWPFDFHLAALTKDEEGRDSD